MRIKVYGVSDDLIKSEKDIYWVVFSDALVIGGKLLYTNR